MTISTILTLLERIAPPYLQESYDNAGLIIGNSQWECGGVLVALDATKEVINEAIEKKCNLVVVHHPIIFKGLQKINGKNYVEQAIITAIKNDIAIYAIHTNLDNVIDGVNGKIADKLGLINRSILQPKNDLIQKLVVFVPIANKDQLLQVLFEAGAGNIGNYSECSFVSEGIGTFKPGENAHPFSGTIGVQHSDNEIKIEVVFPIWLQGQILSAMKQAHPYEEVAYEVFTLANSNQMVGSGLIGELAMKMDEKEYLKHIKEIFNTSVIRHTLLLNKPIKRVAVCGGAGSFLTSAAIAKGADIYITADVKYHEFFDAEQKLVIADIGHFESEQYTIDLLADVLRQNFPNFAVLKTGVLTNPVHYF